MGDVREYGRPLPRPFARYDHESRTWKTSQGCEEGALTSFQGTWPVAGMTLNGYAYRLPPWAPLTCATDGLPLPLLPTPTAADNIRGPDYARASRPDSGGDDLVTTLARLGETGWGKYGPAVERWERVTRCPAPAPIEIGPRGGKRLSPRFVEWLMGLPAAWVMGVRGMDRTEALRAIGNSAVPLQAYRAYRYLTRERK